MNGRFTYASRVISVVAELLVLHPRNPLLSVCRQQFPLTITSVTSRDIPRDVPHPSD